jgi:hypothetical protein
MGKAIIFASNKTLNKQSKNKPMKMKSLLLVTLATLGLTAATMAQNLPNYVPTNGIVGWWPFNGNANDESGNGNNGNVNGATLTTDRFGVISKAYSFDGVDDQIDIQNSNNLNFTNTFTISIWHYDRTLNFQSVTQGKQGFLVSKVASGTSDGYWFVSQNNNTGPFSCNTPNKTMNVAFYQGISTSPIQCIDTLTWHNIIFSMQNGNYKTYLNGVLVDSSITTLNNILPNSLPMIFGFVSNPGNNDGRFNGILDDIGIWNRALTQQEITDLYNANICYQNITVTDTLLINMGITGFNPVTYNNTIKIFPNPTNDHITINYGNFTSLNGYQLKIINSLGQQVFQTNVVQQSDYLNLTTWGGNGLYFVQIIDSQGNIIDIRKIVLQ